MKIFLVVSIMFFVIILSAFYLFKTNHQYDGHWITDGYGLILEINKGKVSFYERTGQHLVKDEAFKARIKGDVLLTSFGDFKLVSHGASLALINPLGNLLFSMQRDDNFNSYTLLEHSQDPKTNFDIFWTTFEENYPFFELYAVDWQAQKETYKEQVNEENLDEVLKTMVEALNDGHVEMDIDGGFTPYKNEPLWHKDGLSKQFVEVIANEYVKDMAYSKDRLIRHGHLTEDKGYVLIASMAGYTHEGDAIKNIGKAFQKALEDLKDCKQLVLDLRFNTGGYDRTGLELASYLTDESFLAYKKHVIHNGEKTPLQEVYVRPNQSHYAFDEIIVLLSGATVSAAETFILAMDTLDKVTLIGEPSAGFYADMMTRHLPNGVVFSLPHYVYYKADGTFIEGSGIAVDQIIKMAPSNIELRCDPALEYIKTKD